MCLEPYQGSVNYPTYVARQWIRSGEQARENWTALISAFDSDALGSGEMRALLAKVLAPVLDRRANPLARELAGWTLNKIHWREILEDIRRSLSANSSAGQQAGQDGGNGQHGGGQAWGERQRFQHLPSSRGYANEPTAIIARWLDGNRRALSRLHSYSSPAMQEEALSELVRQELSRAQARSRLAAQLLNWVLTLVDYSEVVQQQCANPAG